MSIWLIVVLVGSVPALAAVWAWREWLQFCRHIADHHGIDNLKLLPPLATAYRTHRWSIWPLNRGEEPAKRDGVNGSSSEPPPDENAL